MSTPFWQQIPLDQMSPSQWESLCDGCARCCLQKLEDEESGEVFYTELVCHYLDEGACRCTVYRERNTLVPTCVWLKPEHIPEFHWLPETCAYRLVAEGQDLPDWHPLISGDPESVHRAGISVRGKVIPDDCVPEEDWEEHLIELSDITYEEPWPQN